MTQYCVFASTLRTADGRDWSVGGDGYVDANRRIYAICDSEADAQKELARLNALPSMTKRRMPGDDFFRPDLDVGEFRPLQFVGRQSRDNYRGKLLPTLIARLHEEASKNAAALVP